MEKFVYLEDFPKKTKVKLKCSFAKDMFRNAVKKLNDIEIPIKGFDEEFIFGETYGKIIKALKKRSLRSKEIIKICGISESTFYHRISDLKKRGYVGYSGRKYFLKKIDKVKFSELKSFKSLNPNKRRKAGVSKEDLLLALYLHSLGLKDYDVYVLAALIKMWKSCRRAIPIEYAIEISKLSGTDINKGVEYVTLRKEKFFPKLPIILDKEAETLITKLILNCDKKMRYHGKDKKEFLKKIKSKFGDFHGDRIPKILIEIFKKYYGEKFEHILDVDNIKKFSKHGSKVFVLKVKSRYIASIIEDLLNMSGYICKISRERDFYKITFAENNFDIEMWKRIPLNRIEEKIKNAKSRREVIEICREELRTYIISILKSIERDHSAFRSMKISENEAIIKALLDYFWKEKKIPSYRSVKEKLSEKSE